MTALQTQFLAVLTGLNIDSVTAQPLWQNLQTHYQEPHRFYHNLSHIQALYSHFERIKSHLKDPQAVALAIFYHDVIYDPKQSDNEVQSVHFFKKALYPFLSKALLERVKDLILATQNHQLTDPHDTDMAYFLDMDLAILGSDKAAYETYAHAIRQEYGHFTDADYRQGRSGVLNNFLQRQRLFFTAYFFAKYEIQARYNLQQEIGHL